MIDATHLTARRTAPLCSRRSFIPPYRVDKKRSEFKASCFIRRRRLASLFLSDGGEPSDLRGADVVLPDLPNETEEVIGDRGYDSNRTRQSFKGRNVTACIPPEKNKKLKPPYNRHLYKKRCLIGNIVAKLKHLRRIATRYDRCTHTLMSAIYIATTFTSCVKE